MKQWKKKRMTESRYDLTNLTEKERAIFVFALTGAAYIIGNDKGKLGDLRKNDNEKAFIASIIAHFHNTNVDLQSDRPDYFKNTIQNYAEFYDQVLEVDRKRKKS